MKQWKGVKTLVVMIATLMAGAACLSGQALALGHIVESPREIPLTKICFHCNDSCTWVGGPDGEVWDSTTFTAVPGQEVCQVEQMQETQSTYTELQLTDPNEDRQVKAKVYWESEVDPPGKIWLPCPGYTYRHVILKMYAKYAGAEECDTAYQCSYVTFHLHCLLSCDSSAVHTSGESCLLPQSFDQKSVVVFVVTNLDTTAHEVNLELSSSQSWEISPSVPSWIYLHAGESRHFYLYVTIPGGTPHGTLNEIVLTSRLAGVPLSSASGTATLLVTEDCLAPIPTLTEWGMIIFGVVLLGFISWVFLKRRRAVGVRV